MPLRSGAPLAVSSPARCHNKALHQKQDANKLTTAAAGETTQKPTAPCVMSDAKKAGWSGSDIDSHTEWSTHHETVAANTSTHQKLVCWKETLAIIQTAALCLPTGNSDRQTNQAMSSTAGAHNTGIKADSLCQPLQGLPGPIKTPQQPGLSIMARSRHQALPRQQT